MTPIWRVTIRSEETRTTTSDLYSAKTKQEAINKALSYIPRCADWSKIKVLDARIESFYKGDPRNLVI